MHTKKAGPTAFVLPPAILAPRALNGRPCMHRHYRSPSYTQAVHTETCTSATRQPYILRHYKLLHLLLLCLTNLTGTIGTFMHCSLLHLLLLCLANLHALGAP